ncbi:MAG: energy transducer TonB [Prevotella sp.]|nr:energy transducer TonB [Prevotella sp.]
MRNICRYMLAGLMMMGLSSPAMAQDVDSITNIESKKVFGNPEMQPTFNGDINLWLAQNMRYPKEAVKNNIEGKVIVSFVIEKDGSVSNIKALKSPHSSLTEEVVRLVKAMPNWNPGTMSGKPVRVKYTLPLSFKLQ